MDKALQFPGVSNAWTMPIKPRIDMLSTGIRTPIGVKVIGTDLVEINKLAKQIEQVLKAVPGTSSAYAERGIGGYYLEVTPDRTALARYGIMVQDVQDTIATALGGQTVTTTVEGRQRFTVNMRYPHLRDNPQAIANDVLVPMPAGGAVPLGEVAKVKPGEGTDLDPDRDHAAIMQRIAVPMIGGMVSSTLLTLIVILHEMMPGMTWGMGLFRLLVAAVLLLAAAALVKYLLSSSEGRER